VPYTEIMNLKIGEAFVNFPGIDLTAKATFKLHDRREKEAKVFEELNNQTRGGSEIISLEDFLRTHPAAETDLNFCKIPLNDSITSKPIYFFDESTALVSQFLEDARALNKRVVVFEDGSKYYDACFKKDRDILLNPKHGGRAWDMLGEFEGNYPQLTKLLVESTEFTEDEAIEAEKYFFRMFSHLHEIISEATSANMLNALIFRSFAGIAPDLENILNLKIEGNLQTYSYIREKMSLYLEYLKPLSGNIPEISVGKYIAEVTFDSSILFISGYGDKNAVRTTQLIADYTCFASAFKIFASSVQTPKSARTFIDASKVAFFDQNSTIISSAAEIYRNDNLRQFFPKISADNENQLFAKVHGINGAVALSH
jgi:hypothetical protein